MKILIIYGSLRQGSFNKALANAAAKCAPEGVEAEVRGPGELPSYDQDIEASAYPPAAQAYKDAITAADGIIVATPEYNRSVPGVLKNLLDWTSRPTGTSPWSGKPVGVLGATGGSIGTSLAQAHLRNIFSYLNAHIMGQPEFYLSGAREKFSAEGELTDEKTRELLAKFMATFVAHVELFKK